MLYHVTIGNREFRVRLEDGRVLVDDIDAGAADLAVLPGTSVRHLLLGGLSIPVVEQRSADGWNLHVAGWPLQAQVIDERTRAIRAMTARPGATTGPRPVKAPMPGLIVRVDVAEGDRVRAGQGVVVMEAMKMENELKAENDGVVIRILAQPGQAVEKGTILVELGPA